MLRGQLSYQGVVITDTLGTQGIVRYMQQQGYSDPAQGITEASVRMMLAGDDLILYLLRQTTLGAVVTAMTQAVRSGRISRARLLASVHRIIRLRVRSHCCPRRRPGSPVPNANIIRTPCGSRGTLDTA